MQLLTKPLEVVLHAVVEFPEFPFSNLFPLFLDILHEKEFSSHLLVA